MGPRSKIKGARKSIMHSKSSYYSCALLGICIACLPLYVVSQSDESFVIGASDSMIEPDDLEAAESQNIGVAVPPQVAPMTAVAAEPAPSGITIPNTDLAGAPSYAPRYAMPPVNPYRERLPYEVANFRRRATEDEGPIEDDYVPSESKGKKSSPGIFKRVTSSIRNTGKAIAGAPQYILKRYRGTWKKYWGGGKKKKGWKSWTSSSDGWGGWEESEPSGGWDEPSEYPSDKGWKSSSSTKGWSTKDSHERRSDRDRERERERESSNYRNRDYRDDYDRDTRPSKASKDKPRWTSSYREETHYDDYDGRRTTATYGPSRRSKRPPSSSGSNYDKYDDEY